MVKMPGLYDLSIRPIFDPFMTGPVYKPNLSFVGSPPVCGKRNHITVDARDNYDSDKYIMRGT